MQPRDASPVTMGAAIFLFFWSIISRLASVPTLPGLA
jgi:hypothetical protein